MRARSVRWILPAAMLLVATSAMAQPVQECIPALVAEANQDGSITLFWSPVPDVTGYQVVVQAEGGEAVPLAPQVPPAATTFTYEDSVPGTLYIFTVAAMNDGVEVDRFCPLEATAVPEFPTPIAAALSVAGGVIALAAMRRRV